MQALSKFAVASIVMSLFVLGEQVAVDLRYDGPYPESRPALSAEPTVRGIDPPEWQWIAGEWTDSDTVSADEPLPQIDIERKSTAVPGDGLDANPAQSIGAVVPALLLFRGDSWVFGSFTARQPLARDVVMRARADEADGAPGTSAVRLAPSIV